MEKIKEIFRSHTIVTTSLLLVMAVVFLLETFSGGSTNTSTLINFGASFNPLIVLDNQWWRLFTAQFVHIGWLHIASNAVMIYYAGSLLEPMIGSGRFLFLYLLSGVGGNLLSFALGNDLSVSAGASTALFGLFGAVIALAIKMRGYAPVAAIGQQFLAIAVINLVLDLFIPSVDILGHLGGLIVGFLLAVLIGGGVIKSVFSNKLRVLALVFLIVYVVYTVRQGMILTNVY